MTRLRHHQGPFILVAIGALVVFTVVAIPPGVQAESPRRGGALLAVIGADPPSLDPHQESTFANIELVAPLYSTNAVVFKLKFPSASLLANLASPWNVIFPKKYLDQDPNYFKTHVVGSGPFQFKSYTRGATPYARRVHGAREDHATWATGEGDALQRWACA